MVTELIVVLDSTELDCSVELADGLLVVQVLELEVVKTVSAVVERMDVVLEVFADVVVVAGERIVTSMRRLEVPLGTVPLTSPLASPFEAVTLILSPTPLTDIVT